MFKNSLIILLILFAVSTSKAQKTGNWCGFDDYFHNSLKDPQFAKSFDNHKKIYEQASKFGYYYKNSTTLIVPTVVHIMHNCYGGNISDDQVLDGIRILNQDYNRYNSDTTQPRSLFLPQGGKMNIEFRLAQIDPNGNCTNGIERIYDDRTNNADDGLKTSTIWPYNKYFNIWIVEEISGSGGGGRILGRAVFPSDPNAPNVYGFLVVNDEWGTIGTAVGSDGRTGTHEIGHNFGLLHIFESYAGSNCNANSCDSSGDFICDTPPQSGTYYSCSTTLNSCSNDMVGGTVTNPNPYSTDMPDMIENYMSYNSCQNMFSKGQAYVMQSSINQYAYLTNLVSPANNIATGTYNGYVVQQCVPTPEFCASSNRVCQGAAVNFFDRSFNAIIDTSVTYTWDFGDGTIITGNQNPSHVYNTPGIFNVKLTLSNNVGSDSIIKSSFVEIIATSGGIQQLLDQGFEYSNFPSHPTNPLLNWKIEQSSTSTWERTTLASVEGVASERIKCFGIPSGKVHSLITPNVDFSTFGGSACLQLKFKVAYAQRSSSTSDQLKVFVSTNCGESWIPRFSKSGSSLSSTGGSYVTTAFVPNSNQWNTYTVNLGTFASSSSMLIKFELTSGLGNYLYLDSISMGCPLNNSELISFEENVEVFPNPFTNDLNINLFSEKTENVMIKLFDYTGKEVFNTEIMVTNGKNNVLISKALSKLNNGIYFIQLLSKNEILYNKKIIKEDE